MIDWVQLIAQIIEMIQQCRQDRTPEQLEDMVVTELRDRGPRGALLIRRGLRKQGIRGRRKLRAGTKEAFERLEKSSLPEIKAFCAEVCDG